MPHLTLDTKGLENPKSAAQYVGSTPYYWRRLLPFSQHQCCPETALQEPDSKASAGPDAPGAAVHLRRSDSASRRETAIGAEADFGERRQAEAAIKQPMASRLGCPKTTATAAAAVRRNGRTGAGNPATAAISTPTTAIFSTSATAAAAATISCHGCHKPRGRSSDKNIVTRNSYRCSATVRDSLLRGPDARPQSQHAVQELHRQTTNSLRPRRRQQQFGSRPVDGTASHPVDFPPV